MANTNTQAKPRRFQRLHNFGRALAGKETIPITTSQPRRGKQPDFDTAVIKHKVSTESDTSTNERQGFRLRGAIETLTPWNEDKIRRNRHRNVTTIDRPPESVKAESKVEMTTREEIGSSDNRNRDGFKLFGMSIGNGQKSQTTEENAEHTIADRRDSWSQNIESRVRQSGIHGLQEGDYALVAFERYRFSSGDARLHGDFAIVKRVGDTFYRNSGYISPSTGTPWKAVPSGHFSGAGIYAFKNQSFASQKVQEAEQYKGQVHYCYRNLKHVMDMHSWIASNYSSCARSSYKFNYIPSEKLQQFGLYRAS